jgi:DNA-binding NarL/FixJ family response regulator
MPRADVNSYAEVLATRGLYEAVRGDPSGVTRICRRADDLSHSAEVRVLTAWAKALAYMALSDGAAATQVRSAVRRSVRSGIFDSLVVAYRAAPQILDLIRLSASDEERDLVNGVMSEADDEVLSGAHGMMRTSVEAPLTPREAEVLQLVAAGLSNQDIASQLFISLATAKVHVQHIMEKLDARSRTEAAMKGVALAGQVLPQTARDTAGDGTDSPTRRPSR